MTIIVVGASGATGQLLAKELLARGQTIKIILRSLDGMPESIVNHGNVSVVQASILDMSDDEMAKLVHGDC